jgi:beta-lactamase regulating signal transducer with metallopeptidase domain
MKFDTANRSFFALVAIALVPYGLLGLFGCCFVLFVLYRLATDGFGAIGGLWPAIGLFGIIGVGTLVGVAALRRQLRATHTLVDHIRRTRRRPDRSLQEAAHRAGLTNQLDVVEDATQFSFAYGLLRPRVAISTGLIDVATPGELEAVLEHERYHVRSLDPLKMVIAHTASRAFFFLPALRDYQRRYLVGRELAADQQAVSAHGRSALAGALYKVVRGPTWPELSTAAAIGGDDILDIRIAQLEAGREPAMSGVSKGAFAVTVVVVMLLVAAFVATVVTLGSASAADAASSGSMSATPALNVLGCAACAAFWVWVGWVVHRRRVRSRGLTPGSRSSTTAS